MDYFTESMSADEHDRLTAVHGPLTDAVRRLIEAGLRTGVDAEEIARARAAIDAVSEMLESRERDAAQVRHADTGRPVVWANPVVGVRNAMAPPLVIDRHPDERWRSDFHLGPAYEGPPGWVHGGICALVLDQILGEAASEGLTKPRFTGTITLKYLRGTPLGPLRAEAWVDRVDGFKTYARGELHDADGVTVEAEGVFIMPSWAREAG